MFLYKIRITSVLFLVLSGKFKQINRWDHSGRSQNNHLLVYVTGGHCTFSVDGETYSLSENDAVLIPANSLYIPATDTECEYYYFHFGGEVTRVDEQEGKHDITAGKMAYNYCERMEANEIPALYLYPKMHVEHSAGIRTSLIPAIHRDMMSVKYNSKLSMNVNFLQLLLALSNVCAGQYLSSRRECSLTERVVEYIGENLVPDLTLSKISRHFGYTKQYIIRQFASQLHTTPTKYINSLKLISACRYMQHTAMNIAEIAELCGFHDANYFSRLFSREMGMSPQQYRNGQR